MVTTLYHLLAKVGLARIENILSFRNFGFKHSGLNNNPHHNHHILLDASSHLCNWLADLSVRDASIEITKSEFFYVKSSAYLNFHSFI